MEQHRPQLHRRRLLAPAIGPQLQLIFDQQQLLKLSLDIGNAHKVPSRQRSPQRSVEQLSVRQRPRLADEL